MVMPSGSSQWWRYLEQGLRYKDANRNWLSKHVKEHSYAHERTLYAIRYSHSEPCARAMISHICLIVIDYKRGKSRSPASAAGTQDWTACTS